MIAFEEIFDRAARRKGGEDALRAMLPSPASPAKIKATPADRFLAEMTRAIFQAGFNWKVVDNKWEGFEEAFEGFDLGRWHFMSDDDVAMLMDDTRIVRLAPKIRAVQANATMLLDVEADHGSAGKFFADWPSTDFVGLLAYLKKNGSRIGGATAQYFLRSMQIDGFILSRDGVAALRDAGIVDRESPTSKRDQQAIQEAYNVWMEESGLPLMAISRVLSMSIGDNHLPADT
jgi:3-methyladenine DNA glycosylase Tag